MWRLNPTAHEAFQQMGYWAIALMVIVGVACAFASMGLWLRARWGHRLAVLLLVVNLFGDTMNALLRGDLRTLIGVPIGGVLIVYLLSPRVRGHFASPSAA